MLVLSRQRDETIMIGDDVEITIVDIRGDKVRLGINAPTRISVHRKEVYEAIRAENKRASQINSSDLDELRKSLPSNGSSPPPQSPHHPPERARPPGPQRPAGFGGNGTLLPSAKLRPGQSSPQPPGGFGELGNAKTA